MHQEEVTPRSLPDSRVTVVTAVGQWSAVKAAQKVQSAVKAAWKYTEIWSTVRLQCGTIQSRYGYVHMDKGQWPAWHQTAEEQCCSCDDQR